MEAINEHALKEALDTIFPSLDPASATISSIRRKIADHLGVDDKALRAQWNDTIRELTIERMQAPSTVAKDVDRKERDTSVGSDRDSESDTTTDTRTSRKRKNVVESDADDDAEDDGASDGSAEAESDGSEDESPSRKQRKKLEPRVRKSKPAPTKSNDDSAGVTALMQLARAAGLMSPRIYTRLKQCSSDQGKEDVLRDLLADGGVTFTGRYPKKSDVAEAKKAAEKKKELDGIDTSAIITGPRSRRAASLGQPRYAEENSEELDSITGRFVDEMEEKESSDAASSIDVSDEE